MAFKPDGKAEHFAHIRRKLLRNQNLKFNITAFDSKCPRSLDPFYMVSYYTYWVKTIGQTLETNVN